METLKDIVKGTATMDCVRSGGIAEYIITSCNGKRYMLEIDLSNRVDCGDSDTFSIHYPKAIILCITLGLLFKNRATVNASFSVSYPTLSTSWPFITL